MSFNFYNFHVMETGDSQAWPLQSVDAALFEIGVKKSRYGDNKSFTQTGSALQIEGLGGR